VENVLNHKHKGLVISSTREEMTILLCKSNQSTFLVEDIEDQARIPPLKKAIAPMSTSKIGIQSLNIRAGSKTGAMPDSINRINGQTNHKQYRMVGMMTRGRITPRKALKKMGYGQVNNAAPIQISRYSQSHMVRLSQEYA